MLRGTRNPHVQQRTLRFLRSVRLALHQNLKFLQEITNIFCILAEFW